MSRIAEHAIEPWFLERHSPRAMGGDPVPEVTLHRLFEAARWAPSSGNSQPWRFVYARGGTPHFEVFLNLLEPGNRAWCVRAGALILVLSEGRSETGRVLERHSFDAGAAWMSLALQGTMLGLVVHAMAGFNYNAAAEAVALAESMHVECMVAVGYPGDAALLPEKDRAREVPNGRKPLAALVFEGRLPARSDVSCL